MPGRIDPLSAPERMAICAALTIAIEGVVPNGPRETMLHFLRIGLPKLRADADFAVLSTAAAELLDCADQNAPMSAALARLQRAVLPILSRDFHFAMREVPHA